MSRLAVGVDAGGTSTTVSISRDGGAAKTISGAGASASALGAPEAARRIGDIIVQAVGDETADSIVVGAAGAGRSEVASALQKTLAQRFPGAGVRVVDDAQIALRATVPEGSGIVLIAGTGSIAYGEHGSQSFRAGGYGYLLGDDGGGFALGLAAAKLLARAYDGRAPHDELTRKISELLGVNGNDDLFSVIYAQAQPVPRLASLAREVVSLASGGVRSANKLIQAAALDLFELIKTVARKAELTAVACPLVLYGGLLRENSLLSFLLEARIQNELPAAAVMKPVREAHLGALAAAQALTRA